MGSLRGNPAIKPDDTSAHGRTDKTQEINDEARLTGADLIQETFCAKRRKTYIYVNNRLEGNALETIAAMN